MPGQAPSSGFINFGNYLSGNDASGYLSNQDTEEKSTVSGDQSAVTNFGTEATTAGDTDADAAYKQALANYNASGAGPAWSAVPLASQQSDNQYWAQNKENARETAIGADPTASASDPNYTGGDYGTTLQKINSDQTKFMNPAAQFSQNGPLDASLLGGGSANFSSYGSDFSGLLTGLTSAEGNYGTAYGSEYAKDNAHQQVTAPTLAKPQLAGPNKPGAGVGAGGAPGGIGPNGQPYNSTPNINLSPANKKKIGQVP